MTVLTLESAGLAPVILSELGAVRLFDWQPGGPRPVTEDAPDADGMIDTTRYHGAGTVTVGLRLTPGVSSIEARIRRLRAFTHAASRPTLTIDYQTGDVDPVVLILSQGVVTAQTERPDHRDAVAQWKVPSGVLESSVEHMVEANPSGTDELGRTYDLTFNRVYPTSDPLGAAIVVNAGDRDAYPILRMFGPWSGVTSIVNDATGLALVFDNLSVLAGEYLEIDTRAKTILLNGDPTQSRYDRLLFPQSTWWTLIPGEQRVRFVPTVYTAPALTQIIWRDAWS